MSSLCTDDVFHKKKHEMIFLGYRLSNFTVIHSWTNYMKPPPPPQRNMCFYSNSNQPPSPVKESIRKAYVMFLHKIPRTRSFETYRDVHNLEYHQDAFGKCWHHLHAMRECFVVVVSFKSFNAHLCTVLTWSIILPEMKLCSVHLYGVWLY